MKAGQFAYPFPGQRAYPYAVEAGERRFAAAVIREAVKQAAPFKYITTGLHVVEVSDLLAIADNLHALPPPPPTREEMDEALQSLADQIKDLTGHLDERLEVVKAGIAHHCKEQP